jgi:Ca2+-binding RTX toxin-like protein
VLLSADSIGLDLLVSLDAPFAGQAVCVDLDRQDHGTDDDSSSLLLTYLVSSNEADSLLAQDATVPLSEDDSPIEEPLDQIVRPTEADPDEGQVSVVGWLAQTQCTATIAAGSEESTALFDEPSACLIPVERQDEIPSAEGFPIEARGPPAELQTETLLVAGLSAESDSGDVLAATQRAFTFDMSAGFHSIFLRLSTADGAEKLQITDGGGILLAEALLVNTSFISIYGQPCVDDTLTVDLGAGEIPIPIYYDGGEGGYDTLVVLGMTIGSYTPGEVFGDGVIQAGATRIFFTGLEPVFIDGATVDGTGPTGLTTTATTLTFVTPGSMDVIVIDSPAEGQNRISGTSDGVAFEEIIFTNIQTVVIDTGANDVAGADADEIAITSDLVATGLKNLIIRTGAGDDVLRVQTANLSLPVAGGVLSFDGGQGEDQIEGPTPDNSEAFITWNLTGPGAGNLGGTTGLVFTNVESLVGGNGNDIFTFAADGSFDGKIDGGLGAANKLDFSAFMGPVLVNLGMGIATGTVRVSSIQDAQGGSGDDILIGDDGANVLTGGPGNDILVGEAGDDILVGGTDDDIYILTPGSTDTLLELAGAGRDTRDYSAYPADCPVIVNLAAGTATGTTGVAIIENVIGGWGDDILTGDGNANLLIGGPGNDILAGGAGDDTLSGGPGDDTYVMAPGGGTDTIIEQPNEGSDTLDYSAYTTAVTVNLAVGTATGTTGVANIENVIGGSGNDSLTGDGHANRLAGGPGTNTLTGGAGDDTYVLTPGSTNIIVELAGEGSDTLDYSAWTAGIAVDLRTTAAPGTNGIANIENLTGGWGNDTLTGNAYANRLAGGPGTNILTGGAGDDTYVLTPGSTNTIIELAGEGSDTLDYSAFTTGVTVNLSTKTAPGTAPASNMENIENVIGGAGDDTLIGDGRANRLTGGPGNDTLIGGGGDDVYILTPDGGADTITELDGGGLDTILGPDVATDWIITGPNSGVITGGTTFVGIEYLVGGNADDNLSSRRGGNLRRVEGGGHIEGDALVGAAQANTWNITGPNAGTLNGNSFSGIENLIGGSLNDTFVFGTSGSISGLVAGGPDNAALETPPVDTIDYSALSAAMTVDLKNGTAPCVGSFDGIDLFIGSAESDTVIGYDLPELFWTITGPDEFTVAAISFQGFENLTGQPDNTDGFIVEAGGSITGVIDGGTGGTDGLFINTGWGIGMIVDVAEESATPTTTDPAVYGKALTYKNLDPQPFDFFLGDDRGKVVIAGTIFDDTIRVYDNAGVLTIERGNSTYTIGETQLAMLTLLRIEGRAGSDTITIESLPANFGGDNGADLWICGSHMPADPSVAQIPVDDPFIDRVNFTGSIDLKQGSLDVWADRITVADNVVIQTTNDITFRPRLLGIAELENLVPLGFGTDRKVDITIGKNAKLMGAEISLFAQAEDKSIADTAGAPKEMENFVIQPLMDKLGDLFALPVKVLVKNCTATITFREGAQLIATGPIGIYATAAADATGVAKGNLISIGYAQAKAYADIIIEAGVLIQAAEAIVITSTGEAKAGMKVDTKHKIDNLPNPSGAPFAIALGVSYADSYAHVTVAQGAVITSDRTANLTAKGKIESEAEAESGVFADGKAGLAFALEFSKADVDTTVDGTIIAKCDPVGGYAVKLEIDPTVGLNPDGTPQIGYVDYANNRIYVGPNALITEDTVTYSNRRGVSIGGLVNGREYYIVTDGDGWIQFTESEINAIRADVGKKEWLVDLKDKSGTELETANNQKSFTAAEVNSADDTITLKRDGDIVFNTFEMGQAVVFRAGSGSSIGGLTPGNTYYVIASTTEHNIQGDTRLASKQIIRLAETENEARAGIFIDLGAATGSDFQLVAKHVFDSGFATGVGVFANLEAETKVSAKAGLKSEDTDPPSKWEKFKDAFDTNLYDTIFQKLTKSYTDNAGKSEAGASGSLAVSGALAFSYADHDVTSNVGDHAVLKSNEDLEVNATIAHKYNLGAESSTEPQSGKDGKSAANNVSVAVAVAIFNNSALATVNVVDPDDPGPGAELDALRALRVISNVTYPLLQRLDTYIPLSWSELFDSIRTDGLKAITKYIDSTLGFNSRTPSSIPGQWRPPPPKRSGSPDRYRCSCSPTTAMRSSGAGPS